MNQITAATQVTGIIGYPISHTLSPLMHNNAFSSLGLDFVYVVFYVMPEELSQAVKGLAALNIKGINVTIPYKQRVIPLLDDISPEAQIIGAVNTILMDNGRLVGYNTDGYGFITSLLEAGFDPAGKKILLLGAGGASRAIALALGWSHAERIVVAARKIDQAEQLTRAIKLNTEAQTDFFALANLPTQIIKEADLIVNATPLGMHPHENNMPLIAMEAFHSDQYVCDLIYNPLETQFLKQAKSQECKIINGVGMLVHQGAKAFYLWTKKTAPVEEMRQVVLDYVGKGRNFLP